MTAVVTPSPASQPEPVLQPTELRNPYTKALNEQVLGQPLALRRFDETLLMSAWMPNRQGRPETFLLAGPSATGKSTFAQALRAEWELRGGEHISIDLSSMRSHNEGFGLIGLRAGYDSAGPGRLTSFVQEHPNALVVLENVTQAHPNVQALLIPLLTTGKLADEYGFGAGADRVVGRGGDGLGMEVPPLLVDVDLHRRVFEFREALHRLGQRHQGGPCATAITRNLAGIEGAGSSEFNNYKVAVVGMMTEWQRGNQVERRERGGNLGGTMRLGAYPCELQEGTIAREAYGVSSISERHRHRYEVNNKYREQIAAAGMVFSGMNTERDLVEFVELPREVHPYYVGTQAHPEFKSRPTRPHPLFAGLIKAALARGR